MQYRTLGRTGLRISEIGLGGHEYRRKSFVKDGRFTVLDPSRPAVVKKAIDSGINYFDTTFFEETQSLGTALKVNGIKRSQVHLSGMSIDLMKTAGEKSADTLGAFVEREITQRLELLGTDYFDIFQICAIDAGYTPDILDAVLEHLEQANIQWGVVTNKPAHLTEPLLDTLGLMSRCACVVSGDTLAERKPHPRPLLHAAEIIGTGPAQAMYVGDASRDIEAGRAAGMMTVAAAYGFIMPGDDPAAWQADHCIDNPLELIALVERYA